MVRMNVIATIQSELIEWKSSMVVIDSLESTEQRKLKELRNFACNDFERVFY
jgi:hypothetical protein